MVRSKAPGKWRYLAIVLLVLLGCSAVFAQIINGTISGDVKDATGAYIPKANVTVKDPAIGVNRTTTTNSSGMFVVPNLPPGKYTVSVVAQGFKQLDKTDITLGTGDHVNAGELVLEVGAAGTTVTVEADAGQIQVQADSGERSGTITGNQLNNLAMNGRMLFDYVKVLPGVISTFNGAQSGKGGMGDININGARGGQMQLTIDGITNVDNGCNCASQITINPDAVAEVKVLTSNFQAEYGKSIAQMAVTTKNGTSQFHGNGRWFHRNEGLNAAQWFDDQSNAIDVQAGRTPQHPKQPYRYNYFGWQVGGPLILPKTGINKNKDKLYFFFSQEYYRQLIPGGFDNVYVPTLDEINGDFSKSYDGNGNKISIKDPATGQPFAGNIIPAGMLNKSVQQYMTNVLPRPNATDNEICSGSSLPGGICNHYNFITSLKTNHPRREDIGRLDYQINPANRLYFTVVNNAGTQQLPEGLSPQGISNFQIGQGMFLQEPGYNVSTHLTSTLSNTLVNEATFGWTINQQHIYSINDQVFASKWNLSLPLMYSVGADSPLPDMSFGGRNAVNSTWSYFGSLPWNNADTVINFTDNITKVVGKHTLKAGIFIERNRKDQSSWGNANGTYNFSSTDSNQTMNAGDPYANALLGYFTSFQQSSSRPRGFYRYTNVEFFLQDNFKVTHRLTLDYGMRFSWVQPQFDANNQVVYFDKDAWDPSKAVRLYKPTPTGGMAYDPLTGAQVSSALIGKIVPGSGDPLNGMVSSKNGGYPGGFEDRGLMPEPRFGFAYDVFGNGKTVVRGGAGISHDRFQGNPIYNLVVGNPPNSYDPTFHYGTLSDITALASQADVKAPVDVIGFQKAGKVPTTYSFSFGIQHDLGFGTTLDVAYVGSQSRHLSQKYNLNAIPYGALFTAAAQDPSKYGGTVTPQVTGGIYQQYGVQYMGDKAYDQAFLEPYQGYNNIEYWNWDGDANYNSLQVSANKHFSKGLTFGVAYTWSKTMDTSNSDGQWTNIVDPKKYNYTLASWDRPQVLAINWTYDLPKLSKRLGGSKVLSYILDGYQWEGIGQFLQGGPGTINGNFSEPDWGWWGYSKMITGSYTEGPNTYVNGNPTAKTGDPYSHLNPAAFVGPPTLGLPSSPWQQNYFRSGGTNNWDMSIFKNIPLGKNEARYIQMRVEAFNVFNHPQFWGINTDAGAVSFNGNYNPWDGNNGFINSVSAWNNSSVVMPSKIRPAGTTGNMGQYFGEYNGGGNARIVQLGVKVYF